MSVGNLSGVTAAIVTIMTGVSVDARPIDPERVAACDQFVQRLDHLGFDGVVYAAQGDEVLIDRGCGLANRAAGVPWSSETVSTIGSITKQFTGAAILKLQEAGKLAVTDTIDGWFDDVPADKRKITLHHLLTHSSGVQDPPGVGDFDAIARDEYVSRVLALPLEFEPGTRYAYSNAGFSLLAAIIEQVAGAPYEAYLRTTFFKPLGMEDTGYTMFAWSADDVAHGYLADGGDWGALVERPMADDGPWWALRGNGGISSTAKDMHTWVLALLDRRVLNEASMAALWGAHVDESNGDGESFYGYGWVNVEIPGGGTAIMHNGGNGILGADLVIVPSERLFLFAQSNTLQESRLVFRMLEPLAMHLVAGRPLPDAPAVRATWSPPRGVTSGRFVSPDGDAIDVEVTTNGATVTARTSGALAALYGGADGDRAAFDDCSTRVRRMVSGALDGDWSTFAMEYGDRIDEATLRERYGALMQMVEAHLGPLQSWSVVGSAPDEDHIDTIVRFEHERGVEELVFVFAADSPHRLLGRHDGGGLGSDAFYYASVDGGLVSFDESTWSSREAEATSDGLVIGGVTFRRTGPLED